jgi:hypothetical protein
MHIKTWQEKLREINTPDNIYALIPNTHCSPRGQRKFDWEVIDTTFPFDEYWPGGKTAGEAIDNAYKYLSRKANEKLTDNT